MNRGAIIKHVMEKSYAQIRYFDLSVDWATAEINWPHFAQTELVEFYVNDWIDLDEFEDALDAHYGLRAYSLGITTI